MSLFDQLQEHAKKAEKENKNLIKERDKLLKEKDDLEKQIASMASDEVAN